jgi:large subunit ribosomal protein L9
MAACWLHLPALMIPTGGRPTDCNGGFLMKVILKETINSLGIIGSEVKVAEGYARNYLLPQGKAVPATAQYRKILEQEKKKFDLQIAKEKEFAQQMAQRLEGVECTISAKVHEEDRLYGSVTVRDIVDTLAKQDIQVEKRMVLLKEPIKMLGSYKVPIRVYNEVEPEITVHVLAE